MCIRLASVLFLLILWINSKCIALDFNNSFFFLIRVWSFFLPKKKIIIKKKFFARAYYKHTYLEYLYSCVRERDLYCQILMNIYAHTHTHIHAHPYKYTRKLHALLAHCGSVLLLPVWLHFRIPKTKFSCKFLSNLNSKKTKFNSFFRLTIQ